MPTPRHTHVASSICFALLLAACGDGPTGPRQPGVRFVLGAGVTDTVDAQPLQALVVEVRGPGGGLASGIVVRFQGEPAVPTPYDFYDPAVYVCPLAAQTCGFWGGQFTTDTTDANGRAKVTVRLGHAAGPGVVTVTRAGARLGGFCDVHHHTGRSCRRDLHRLRHRARHRCNGDAARPRVRPLRKPPHGSDYSDRRTWRRDRP